MVRGSKQHHAVNIHKRSKLTTIQSFIKSQSPINFRQAPSDPSQAIPNPAYSYPSSLCGFDNDFASESFFEEPPISPTQYFSEGPPIPPSVYFERPPISPSEYFSERPPIPSTIPPPTCLPNPSTITSRRPPVLHYFLGIQSLPISVPDLTRSSSLEKSNQPTDQNRHFLRQHNETLEQ